MKVKERLLLSEFLSVMVNYNYADMKKYYLSFLFCLMFYNVTAQQTIIDSLKQTLSKTNNDSTVFYLLVQIGELYAFNNADSSIHFINRASARAEREQDPLWVAHVNYSYSLYFYVISDYAAALNYAFSCLNGFRKDQDFFLFAVTTHMLATLYADNDFHNEAAVYAFQALALVDTIQAITKMDSAHFLNSKAKTAIASYLVLSRIQVKLNHMDSAMQYADRANEINISKQVNWNYPLYQLASLHQKTGDTETALTLYKMALTMAVRENIMKDVVDNYNGIAEQLKRKGQIDSAIFYAHQAFAVEKNINYGNGKLKATLLLSEAYEEKNMKDSAFHYYKIAMATKDSLFNEGKIRQIQQVAFKEDLKARELRQQVVMAQSQLRNRIRLYVLIAIAVVFFSIAVLLWRAKNSKQKAYTLLQIEKQKVESTLQELKSTQSQLIQSEKMASLGELTAGIAHEIQNPLNFVNNFSEVNTELIEEMKTELNASNNEGAIAIANAIAENEQKINHHGKRADAIVKGMLQHSRSSSGVKEPTDINALADEFLRLAYHGLRAKDKSFNATMRTDFDENIGSINIIPQDIGRVILNLITNAFYAVTEKKKSPLTPKGENETTQDNYEPIVTVTTRRLGSPSGDGGKVEVRVKDNGNGIPQKVLDKIFQPFFITKPTGQGTGLGLSLSYDIIKAHGGEIKVKTEENEGSEFIIILPLSL